MMHRMDRPRKLGRAMYQSYAEAGNAEAFTAGLAAGGRRT